LKKREHAYAAPNGRQNKNHKLEKTLASVIPETIDKFASAGLIKNL
jgi:hypothetical protein